MTHVHVISPFLVTERIIIEYPGNYFRDTYQEYRRRRYVAWRTWIMLGFLVQFSPFTL